ncbi:hypothetical protein [Streptomyces kurssanovii]|uniref:Uncharacterized protein n=1 Tax=Streptomyces kurssanovii TaxID=67312 RepID=A0ABV3HXF0_9ACTN
MIWDDDLLTVAGVPVWLLTVGGGAAVVAVAALSLLRVRASRRTPTPGAAL